MSIFDWFRKDRGGKSKSTASKITASNGVMIEPYWLDEIWRRQAVTLPATLDVPEFFSREPLPPLFPDPEYANNFKEDKHRALHWFAALLCHPDEAVLLSVFRYWKANWRNYTDSEVQMNYRTVLFIAAAGQLLSSNPTIVKEAAEFIWRGYSEFNFKGLLRVAIYDLGDEDGAVAIRQLAKFSPPQHSSAFEAMLREYLRNPAEF